MEKWLSDLDAQWVGSLVRDITGPADAEMARARQRCVAAIEANILKAANAADLEAAVAWRDEKQIFTANQKIPVADNPKLPSAVTQFRTEWRAEEARLSKDRIDKTKALLARFDAILSQAQLLLTQRGRLDDAILVKTKREEVAVRWLSGTPVLVPAKPPASAPAEKAPPAGGEMSRFAGVELEDGNFLPLVTGEKIWSDRAVRITRIPPTFEGLGFTQHKAHGLTLKFKVVSDGLLYLGCSARWGTTAAPEVAKDFVTEDKLLAEGWVRQPNDEIATEASDMLYLMYSRRCKAGEEFSYRTEKYAPPILLWK